MIVVNNTKELELNYELNKIPDDESVMVLGGLAGKEKYNKEVYQRRVTYPARQIKQIINQMKEIENSIPSEWNEWQRAKYIYEVLGNHIGYNYNEEEYKNQQASNLTILLSRKGICAGYSLLFKEMMDRQGIPCDYVRGVASTGRGKSEKHAWNVLQIGEYIFPVDLTWDSPVIRNGKKGLKYFGSKQDFEQTHSKDNDELQYNFTYFTEKSINSINTSNNVKQVKLSEVDKRNLISIAIEETYLKYKRERDTELAKGQVEYAVMSYIKKSKTTGFTRQNGARDSIEDNISREEFFDIVINDYIDNIQLLKDRGIEIGGVLGNSIKETASKYGNENAKNALREYIINNDLTVFTRQNNARQNMQNYMSPTIALDTVIRDFVEREIKAIEKAYNFQENNTQILKKMHFNGGEFAKVQSPREDIVKGAMEWIQRRSIENKYNNQVYDIGKGKEDKQSERE